MCKNPTLFLWEMVKESLGGSGIVYIYQVKCCLLTNKLHKYFSLLLKGTKKRSNFAIFKKKKRRERKEPIFKGSNILVEKCSWVTRCLLHKVVRISFISNPSFTHRQPTGNPAPRQMTESGSCYIVIYFLSLQLLNLEKESDFFNCI